MNAKPEPIAFAKVVASPRLWPRALGTPKPGDDELLLSDVFSAEPYMAFGRLQALDDHCAVKLSVGGQRVLNEAAD